MVYDLRNGFIESMDDDFNIAPALASLFEFAHKINRLIDQKKISNKDGIKVERALKDIDSVLGVMRFEWKTSIPEVEEFIKERDLARKRKDWLRADKIRDQLMAIGIRLVDTPDGTMWWRIED